MELVINTGTDKFPLWRRFTALLMAGFLSLSQTVVLAQEVEFEEQTSTVVRPVNQTDAPEPDQPKAWPYDFDIDPPVIDHEAFESGKSGETQQFTAMVVDDQGLKHVRLYYRNNSGIQYQSVDMQSAEGSSEYTALVETSDDQGKIEYYIEALDTGGNRVLKGFPFFPLVRELESMTPPAPTPKESVAGDNRIIYVLLGVAAVGVIAALASGGDDTTTQPPPPNTTPLTINITAPTGTP